MGISLLIAIFVDKECNRKKEFKYYVGRCLLYYNVYLLYFYCVY